jgi:hypothetical protein
MITPKASFSGRAARPSTRRTQRLPLYFAAAWAALMSAGACTDATEPVIDQLFSFEADFDGWVARAVDVTFGGPAARWEVSRSSATATDGQWAVDLWLENNTDAAKVWLGRDFTVAPNRDYRVTIDFDFATADFGYVNHFRLIAGALPHTATDRPHLEPFYRGETGNGQPSDVGYRWLRKTYQAVARSASDGTLHVFFGIWGTYEVTRRYYFDAVRVRIDAL